MNKSSFILAIFIFTSSLLFSQIAINEDGSAPDASAALDIYYTNKGLLPPRMTSDQRTAIPSPATGLLVFQTDVPSGYYYYNGTTWTILGSGDGYSGNVIDIDGNIYATVKIGNQEWMAENLRVTHYRNGDAIPNVTVNGEWILLTNGAYCWYDNNESDYAKYGILYNWHAVNDIRSLCPVGCHVPSVEEWITLTTYLGGENVAGGKMKVRILWDSPNTGAINTSGFSGLPGGYRYGHGTFDGANDYSFWWTSTEIDDLYAEERNLCYDSPEVGLTGYGKDFGFSVRCIRDE